MFPTMKHLVLTLVCGLAATAALSQSEPTPSRYLTLAPAKKHF